MTFSGVWLPIVTPLSQGEIDGASYERIVHHYVEAGVAGLIPLGTTGESPTVDEAEADELIERTVAAVAGRVPVQGLIRSPECRLPLTRVSEGLGRELDRLARGVADLAA